MEQARSLSPSLSCLSSSSDLLMGAPCSAHSCDKIQSPWPLHGRGKGMYGSLKDAAPVPRPEEVVWRMHSSPQARIHWEPLLCCWGARGRRSPRLAGLLFPPVGKVPSATAHACQGVMEAGLYQPAPRNCHHLALPHCCAGISEHGLTRVI